MSATSRARSFASAAAASRARSAAPRFFPASIFGTAIAAAAARRMRPNDPQIASLRHGTGGTSIPFGGVQMCSQAPRISQRERRGSADLVAECTVESRMPEGVAEALELGGVGIRSLRHRRAHFSVQHLYRKRRNRDDGWPVDRLPERLRERLV